MIAISIDLEGAPEQAVARVRTFIGSDAILKIAGYEGQRVVREHLQGLDDNRANKLGGRRTHYYGSARRATEYRMEGDAVIINIPQIGLPLHYHGGTVRAGVNASSATGQPTKYLSIPARAEAYGRRPSDFPNLVVVWGRNKKPVGLAVGEKTSPGALFSAVTRKHGPMLTKDTKLQPGLMMFWLKLEVTMQPDHTILPTEETISTAVKDRIASVIVRRFGGAVAGPDEVDLGGGI